MRWFKVFLLGLLSLNLFAQNEKGIYVSTSFGVSSLYSEAVAKLGYQFNEKYALFAENIDRASEVQGSGFGFRLAQPLEDKLASYFELGYLEIQSHYGLEFSLGMEREMFSTEKLSLKNYIELNSKMVEMYDSYASKTIVVGVRMLL